MTSVAIETKALTLEADIDMRNTSGLTRRAVASIEEGDLNNKGEDEEVGKAPTPSLAKLAPNAFRDAIRCISSGGPAAFYVAVIVSFLACIHSAKELRASNTFFNFLHFYLTITLMILSIAGLMHVLKSEILSPVRTNVA